MPAPRQSGAQTLAKFPCAHTFLSRESEVLIRRQPQREEVRLLPF